MIKSIIQRKNKLWGVLLFTLGMVLLMSNTANANHYIMLKGADTVKVEVYSAFIDPGAAIPDSISQYFTVKVSGKVDTALLGFYALTYIAIDTNGNAADSVTRVVEVADIQPPIIRLVGPRIILLRVGDTYTDSGYVVVSDNYWTVASITVDTLTNDFKGDGTDLPGGYFIRYTSTDRSGNKAFVERLIAISDGGSVAELSAFPGTVNIFPNPATKGIFYTDITLEKLEHVRISILNMLGQQIRLLHDGKLKQQISPVELHEKAGIYIIRVQAANAVITKHVIITK